MGKSQKFIAAVAAIALSFGMAGCASPAPSPTSAAPSSVAQKSELTVYAGAGLKRAMEQIKKDYEAANPGITINYIYAGSGQLLGQMESSRKGDVFIVGSADTYDAAKSKGLAGEPMMVAYHTPAIAVAKGNPKGIKTLADLAKPGLRVVLGDPKSNAIGVTSQKMFEKNKITGVDANVVARTGTVTEILTALTAGNADAGIVTKDGFFGNADKLDLIEIPADQNIDQVIPVGALTISSHPEAAKAFAAYVGSDKGKATFDKAGFPAYKG